MSFHCTSVRFSNHAIKQMFARNIAVHNVEQILKTGFIIAEYKADKPYPSWLVLGYSELVPVHLVVAQNKEDGTCILITANIPDPIIWNETFDKKINNDLPNL